MSLHATIHRYHGVTGSVDEVMDSARRLTFALSQVPGFVVYALLDAGQGVLVSIHVYEDRTGLEAADQLVGIWVAEQLGASPPHPPQVIAGEVIVQRGL